MAEFHEEVFGAEMERKVNKAKADTAFSYPAISRGSTSYPSQKEATEHLSEDDKEVLSKWGMTSDEWIKLKKKH